MTVYPRLPRLSPDEAIQLYRHERAKREDSFAKARAELRAAVEKRLAEEDALKLAHVRHNRRTAHQRSGRNPIAGVLFPMGAAAKVARQDKRPVEVPRIPTAGDCCAICRERPIKSGGRCGTCDRYRRRKGVERPRDIQARRTYKVPEVMPTASGRCGICRVAPLLTRGRCSACDTYLRRHGLERPVPRSTEAA